MKYTLILLANIVLFPATAQEWKPIPAEEFVKVMETCSNTQNQENYEIGFRRKVYANAPDAQPIVSSNGKLIRGKGKEYRMESEGQLLIQTKDVKMVIDSAERVILLMKPDTLFDHVNLQQAFSGASFSSSGYFSRKEGAMTHYKILFPEESTLYRQMLISVDSKTLSLVKVEFSLVAANYMSDSPEDQTMEEPRIIVEYKPAQPLKTAAGYFDLGYWIRPKGDKYVLQPAIDFELEDLRIDNKD